MKYTKLGNSKLKVSRICMGCMGFGDPTNGMHTWTLPRKESLEIINHGLESGINFFDTAIGYQNGTSEMYLGEAVNDFGREDVVIATKFLSRTQKDIEKALNLKNPTVTGILKRLEENGFVLIVPSNKDKRCKNVF